ncbi:MAG: thermonuclease family protein [Thermoleophilaceae bacterium]|nr:thermonuclease family protein [Thermoleophilaceae bacterium]
MPSRSLVLLLGASAGLLALGGCGGADRPAHGRSAGAAPDAAREAPGPRGARVGVVTRVSDGDTIRLAGLGRVRLIGVDTPEVYGQAECYGREASAFVKRLLPVGARVGYRLGVDPRDRYGRALAYVWLRDGRMLNLLLAERGYAVPLTIPPNVDYAERFVAAARRARDRAAGLWSPQTCGGDPDLPASGP